MEENKKNNINKKRIDPDKVIKDIEKKLDESFKNIKNEKEVKKAQKEFSKEVEAKIDYLEKYNADNKNASYILERGNRLLVKDGEILRVKSLSTLKDEALSYFQLGIKEDGKPDPAKKLKTQTSLSTNEKKAEKSTVSKNIEIKSSEINKEINKEEKIVYFKHKDEKSLALPITIGVISILIIIYLVKKHVTKNN